MRRTVANVIVAVSMVSFVGGCGDTGNEHDPGLPNPAVVFCETQGGTASGPEPMCKLPDGSVVDAWEYYRSKALSSPGVPNPAVVFCQRHGGVASGPEPMCTLPDGTVVDAWVYFRTGDTAG